MHRLNKSNDLKPDAIFIAFDDKYFNFAKSFINSIKLNYVNHPKILVRYQGHAPAVVEYIECVDNAQLVFFESTIEFDLGIVQNKIIYDRFYLWSSAFDDYNNILHMDVDTLVLGSLEALFDIHEFFVVADSHPLAHIFLKDDELFYKSALVHNDKNLDIKLQEDGVEIPSKCIPMANAGIFLIPAKYRSSDYFNQLVAIGQKYNDHITYADQSIISLWCFFNNISANYNYNYNFQIRFFSEGKSTGNSNKISIIHFTGDSKNLAKCLSFSEKDKAVHNVFHELRHHFRTPSDGFDYQTSLLQRLDKILGNNIQPEKYIFSNTKVMHIGLQSIMTANFISDISELGDIRIGSIYIFIDKLQEIINNKSILNNKNIDWVLMIDEIFQIDIKKTYDFENFFNVINCFNLVICTDYEDKIFVNSYSVVPTVFIPTAYSARQLNPYKTAVIDTVIFVKDSFSTLDEKCFSDLPYKQKSIFINSLALGDCFNKFEDADAGTAVFIDLTKRSSPWILWAAEKGLMVFGFAGNDYSRHCFPYTTISDEDPEILQKKIAGTVWNHEESSFICELARQRSKRYFNENITYEAYEKLSMYEDIKNIFNAGNDKSALILSNQVRKIFGPDTVLALPEEFVVFSVFKNGASYLTPWLQHYSNLGAKHFFIVDNMSTDDSRDYLHNLSNITLFETDLEFRLFENEIRQYVVKTYCSRMWCLSVDIDEFFDFPHDNKLSMADFLRYQNQRGFTAVLAYMQDMIAKETDVSGDFIIDNIYVDNRMTCIANYADLGRVYTKYNQYPSSTTFCYGGVRSRCFDNDPSQILLLKHALTFQDGNLEPHIDPHFCDKAIISDVSCVLLHYKFMPWFNEVIHKRAEDAVFNFYSTEHYKKYASYLQNEITLFDSSATVYGGIASLIENGFVRVSPAFNDFVMSKNNNVLVDKTPLVSCLCVTSGRAHKLKKAIECFNAQTYSHKELVVICDADDEPTRQLLSDMSSPHIRIFPMQKMNHLPIGTLRNLAIDKAVGEFVCTWDDDDWYNIDRLSIQYATLMRHGKHACILSRILIVDAVNDAAYLAYSRLWENSLFVNKRFLKEYNLSYPATRIGEDYVLVDQLVAKNAIYPLDEPALYLYRISGQNTWPMEHFNHITKKCKRLTEYQNSILKLAFEEKIKPAEAAQKIYSHNFLSDIWYVEPTKEARP